MKYQEYKNKVRQYSGHVIQDEIDLNLITAQKYWDATEVDQIYSQDLSSREVSRLINKLSSARRNLKILYNEQIRRILKKKTIMP